MKTTIKKTGLLIVMLITILPTLAYDFEVDGIYYNIISTEKHTCEITYGDNKYTNDIKIPSSVEYKGRTLTIIRIGSKAFSSCSELVSIIIPDNIYSIGSYAFSNCKNLNTIEISDSVSYIEYAAFYECSDLENINLPENKDFYYIDSEIFCGCSKLKSITIPSNVVRIWDRAFSGCTELESVNIPTPNFYINVGEKAFRYCKNLKNIPIDYFISFEESSFQGCESLKEITIAPLVKNIAPYAFANCTNLKTVYFEGGETKITFGSANSKSPFSECPNLTQLYWGRNIDALNSLSLKDCFPNVDNLTVLEYCDKWWDLQSISKDIKYLTFAKGSKFKTSDDYYSDNFPNIQSLTIEYSIPPSSHGAFSEKQYFNVMLYVPEESIELYKNAPEWKNFWNINAIEETSEVTNIDLERRNIEIIHDLNGNKVDDKYKGIVIIHYSDGSLKKVLQK